MGLKALSGARVLISTDGTNTLYLDTGSEIIPITGTGGPSISAEPGEDGGYYTPNVNTVTGYVTWTPSKDGMPAIAPSNIRGPKGDAGRGVFGIDLSFDTEGYLTGGTVYYDNGDTSAITLSQST